MFPNWHLRSCAQSLGAFCPRRRRSGRGRRRRICENREGFVKLKTIFLERRQDSTRYGRDAQSAHRGDGELFVDWSARIGDNLQVADGSSRCGDVEGQMHYSKLCARDVGVYLQIPKRTEPVLHRLLVTFYRGRHARGKVRNRAAARGKDEYRTEENAAAPSHRRRLGSCAQSGQSFCCAAR